MSITNPDKVVTKQDLADFYDQIKPYLGSYPVAIANKFSKGDLYSTSEKMIGQWTDGKPIYQKVITSTIPESGQSKSVAIGASIDTVVNYIALVTKNGVTKHFDNFTVNDTATSITEKLSATIVTNNYTGSSYSKNSVGIYNLISGQAGNPCCFIIQYTKTTDSSTAIGNETDYSITEKIVGTWIDGKPIYQKTFTGTLPTVTTTGTAVDTFISIGASVAHNIVIKADAILPAGTNIPLPFYSDGQNVEGKLVGASAVVLVNSASSNANKIRIRSSNTGYNNGTYSVTIQYTKTT